MKKIFLIAVMAILSIACENSDDDNNNNAVNISSTELKQKLLNLDNVRLSTFVEDGVNRTGLYADYIFKFESDDTVSASNSNEVVTGTYNIIIDDGRTEIALNFPNNPLFFELNDDWYYVMSNNTSILFEDTSADVLEFVKE
jgi:hypothetical protein